MSLVAHVLPFGPDRRIIWIASIALLGWSRPAPAQETGFGPPTSAPLEPPRRASAGPVATNWIDQSVATVELHSRGCLECHAGTDRHSMHASPNVLLGCTDCHGGNPSPGLTQP